jgi:hypothetical protein
MGVNFGFRIGVVESDGKRISEYLLLQLGYTIGTERDGQAIRRELSIARGSMSFSSGKTKYCI